MLSHRARFGAGMADRNRPTRLGLVERGENAEISVLALAAPN